MKKIYLVTKGNYSDYRVLAAFSNKSLAEDFISNFTNDDLNDIEEYELNPKTTDLINRGYSVWLVHMLRNGNTELIQKKKLSVYNAVQHDASIWQRTKALAYKGMDVQDVMTVYVMAKSEIHAVKIANEKRIQMIANGQWAEL